MTNVYNYVAVKGYKEKEDINSTIIDLYHRKRIVYKFIVNDLSSNSTFCSHSTNNIFSNNLTVYKLEYDMKYKKKPQNV